MNFKLNYFNQVSSLILLCLNVFISTMELNVILIVNNKEQVFSVFGKVLAFMSIRCGRVACLQCCGVSWCRVTALGVTPGLLAITGSAV